MCMCVCVCVHPCSALKQGHGCTLASLRYVLFLYWMMEEVPRLSRALDVQGLVQLPWDPGNTASRPEGSADPGAGYPVSGGWKLCC